MVPDEKLEEGKKHVALHYSYYIVCYTYSCM